MSDEYTSLKDVKIDEEVRVHVKNKQGEATTISFRVTRNAHLNEKTVWIYGMVLNLFDDEYHQIELKLHKDEPERDTIEVFLRAKPNVFKLH